MKSKGDAAEPKAGEEAEDRIPALFATIHYKSPERPDGWTIEEITDVNDRLNSRLQRPGKI